MNVEKPHIEQNGFVSLPVLIGLVATAGVLTLISAGLARQGQAVVALERLTLDSLQSKAAAFRLLSAIEDSIDDTEIGIGKGTDGLVVNPLGQPYIATLQGEAGKINPLESPHLWDSYVRSYGALEPAQAGKLQQRGVLVPNVSVIAQVYSSVGGALTIQEIDADFSLYPKGGIVDPRYASLRVLKSLPDVGYLAEEVVRKRDTDITDVMALSPHFGSVDAPFSILVASPDSPANALVSVRFQLTPDGRVKILDGSPYFSPMED